MNVANPSPDAGKLDLSGVILAGGKSRRMGGSHKALLPFPREILIHRQIRLMNRVCSEIILVTNEPKTFLPHVGSDVRIITDYYAGKGPLAGVHAALSLADRRNVWLVGCDMPFLSPEAARLMLELKIAGDRDAVVPSFEDRLQPLHGIYDKRCVRSIPVMFGSGQTKLVQFLKTVLCETVEPSYFQGKGLDMKFILNFNTPDQYESCLKLEAQEEGRRGREAEKRSHPS